jgi:hypothetical protein
MEMCFLHPQSAGKAAVRQIRIKMLPHINIVDAAKKLVPPGWVFVDSSNGSCAWFPANGLPSININLPNTACTRLETGAANADSQSVRLTCFPQCQTCEYNPCDFANNSDYCSARK